QHGLIRAKLRDVGKLLLATKSICPDIADFSSIYHVKYCNTVIGAIRIVAKFDSKLKQFKSPSTASTLVTLINAIGELLVVESMKADDIEKERSVSRFLKVFQKDVKTKINKLIAVTVAKLRREKKVVIPTTNDISRLAT